MFDPATQKYECEYCQSFFTQSEMESIEPDSMQEQEVTEENLQGEQQASVLYTCPNCGAEIITSETTVATFCYYCHSPVVLSGRVSGEFLPDYIIPFAIDKEKAKEKFLQFVGKKKFIPTAFFNQKQIETFSGVYFPYWIYDCKMNSNMSAYGQKVRIWRSGDMEYTETRRYGIERQGEIQLRSISRTALKTESEKLAEGVFPYDLSAKKKFHMGYLSGFQAEKRNIEQMSLISEVHKEVKGYGGDMLRNTISGYVSVDVRSEQHNIEEENWAYTLLPVWTITYQGKDGKIYYYSMNGQTGNIVGELPIDKKKMWTFSGMIAMAAFVITMIGGILV